MLALHLGLGYALIDVSQIDASSTLLVTMPSFHRTRVIAVSFSRNVIAIGPHLETYS